MSSELKIDGVIFSEKELSLDVLEDKFLDAIEKCGIYFGGTISEVEEE